MNTAHDSRNRDLAKIHLAKKQLGLDEITYRAMLLTVAGVESAADLDEAGRYRVLKHLYDRGFVAKRGTRAHPGQPRNLNSMGRGPLLKKIEALLAEKGSREGRYVSWNYALGILKRQYQVERLEWATAEQLRGVVAALSIHGRRSEARAKNTSKARGAM